MPIKGMDYWKGLLDAWNGGMNDNEVSATLGIKLDEVRRCKSYLENFHSKDYQDSISLTLEEKRKIVRSQLGLDNAP